MKIRYYRPATASGLSMFVMDLPEGLEIPTRSPVVLNVFLQALEATEHLIDWGFEPSQVDEDRNEEVLDFEIIEGGE